VGEYNGEEVSEESPDRRGKTRSYGARGERRKTDAEEGLQSGNQLIDISNVG